MGSGIRREPEGAAEELFDLVIVGGGLQGIMIALEAVRRRLRPLLLERADFGGEMSRGALRLLQEAPPSLRSLLRPPGALDERLWWRQHFPAQVRTLPVVMPLQDGERADAPGLIDRLERRLCGVRRDDAYPDFGRPRALSRDEVLEACPMLRRPGLAGGVIWRSRRPCTGQAVPRGVALGVHDGRDRAQLHRSDRHRHPPRGDRRRRRP